MSQRIRRSLAAAGLLTALCLSLSAPSQAAGLWDPAASARLTVRIWCWLEGLGFTPREPAAPQRRSTARWEKAGGTDTDGATQPPATTSTDQGSGIDPNGLR